MFELAPPELDGNNQNRLSIADEKIIHAWKS